MTDINVQGLLEVGIAIAYMAGGFVCLGLVKRFAKDPLLEDPTDLWGVLVFWAFWPIVISVSLLLVIFWLSYRLAAGKHHD